MLIAPAALLLGPFQFLPGLRARHPQVHRWSGRVYVAACVVAGLGALATTPFASGGPVAGLGFGILAVLWVAATLGAWRAAVHRQFARHRLMMRFSYAMTFAAVTLRLQISLGLALGYPDVFGDVGVARLHMLDPQHNHRRALFADGAARRRAVSATA